MTYDDGSVRADAQGITIRGYYFPTGRPRHVPWSRLRGIEVRRLTAWNGRYRAWGTHRPDWWFGNDRNRSSTSHLVLLRVGRVTPVVTPDDVDAFVEEIRRHRPSVDEPI